MAISPVLFDIGYWLIAHFEGIAPYTIIKFWSFSTLYYYSALYLLLNFGRFPPYTIIPTYTTTGIWNVRVQ